MQPRIPPLRRPPLPIPHLHFSTTRPKPSHHAFFSRPQLPFLSIPLSRRQSRYLTTKRIKYEVRTGLRITFYLWAAGGCGLVAYWSLYQEWLERRYPSPHEWSFISRMKFRNMRWAPAAPDTAAFPWVRVGDLARMVMARLEWGDDGVGLVPLSGDGHIDGAIDRNRDPSYNVAIPYDITAKPENWRRGYYELLLMTAKAAEHLENTLLDPKRHLVVPAEQVPGPSNPNPKPIAPGAPSAPREQDCVPYFESPHVYYRKILATEGFTPRQKLDAAAEYAAWLDHKCQPEAAEEMHRYALQLATQAYILSNRPLPYDPKTLILKETVSTTVSPTSPPPPSENILKTLTFLALHKARTDHVSAALPILISILRARRSLPSHPAPSLSSSRLSPQTTTPQPSLFHRVAAFVSEPSYPAPPPSGDDPQTRDARARCEEAALNVYIGEILFASQAREHGVSWTREGVDLAEEQLRRLGLGTGRSSGTKEEEARTTCRECLGTGLENWTTMVGRLAREEREGREGAKGENMRGESWLGGLWSGGGDGKRQGNEQKESGGRWEAEQEVVKERSRRAGDLLDDLRPGEKWLPSWLIA